MKPIIICDSLSPEDRQKKKRYWRVFTTVRNILMVGILILPAACKKFITIDPPRTQLITATVFANDATATAAMVNVYIDLAESTTLDLARLPGLSADEWIDASPDHNTQEFAENALTPLNMGVSSNLWAGAYRTIYAANAVLEGLEASTEVSPEVNRQLTGEALFIRAWTYLYLVQLFGDSPLVLTTDFNINRVQPRSSVANVLAQVLADATAAESQLSDDYVDAQNKPTEERTRPNKRVAMALLARIHILLGNWAVAEAKATGIIDDPRYALPTDLDAVFLKNSTEAIWQLMPVTSGFNTAEGNQFILEGPPQVVALHPSLVGAFDADDARKTHWIGTYTEGTDTFYFPWKYKIRYSDPDAGYTEYSMVFRLAEQFLIRAEARAQLGDIPGAQADLNAIRQRAGLHDTEAATTDALLAAILAERQKELFTEWGHRWFDLKRMGQANAVLAPFKAGWQPTDQWYPIPQTEIRQNPHLTQNTGY